MKKSFWTSKMLWTNAIALIALGIQIQTGFIIPVEYQTAALAIINFALRLITNAGLE